MHNGLLTTMLTLTRQLPQAMGVYVATFTNRNFVSQAPSPFRRVRSKATILLSQKSLFLGPPAIQHSQAATFTVLKTPPLWVCNWLGLSREE